jgi:heat shock protein HslJ
MLRFLSLSLVSVGIMFGSCTSNMNSTASLTDSTPDPSLLQGTWTVQSLRGVKLPEANPTSAPHLVFDVAQEQVSGSTGCNRLFGSYTAAGTSLRLGPLGTTRMACPLPNPEAELLAVLNIPDLTYRLRADELTLLQGSTLLMVLRRVKQ